MCDIELPEQQLHIRYSALCQNCADEVDVDFIIRTVEMPEQWCHDEERVSSEKYSHEDCKALYDEDYHTALYQNKSDEDYHHSHQSQENHEFAFEISLFDKSLIKANSTHWKDSLGPC